jgi:hypothetical protein
VVGAPKVLSECKKPDSQIYADGTHVLREEGTREMARAFTWHTAVGVLALLRVN